MPLARVEFTATDEAGNVLPGASVQVRSEASGLLVQLYSDRDGEDSIGNPVTADEDGHAAFHVEGGAYQITIASGAVARVMRYVGIGTAAEADIEAIEAIATAAGEEAAEEATANMLVSNVENQGPLTGGASVTSKDLGTQSSGTLTLDMGDRPLQHYANNGAHTLAPGTTPGAILLDITNGASAGAITVSGWTKVAGDAFTTTNGHIFRCSASVGEGGSLLVVQALQ